MATELLLPAETVETGNLFEDYFSSDSLSNSSAMIVGEDNNNNVEKKEKKEEIEEIDISKLREEANKVFKYPPSVGIDAGIIYSKSGTHYCLNENQPFNGVPVPLPLAYNAKIRIFSVCKKFCNFACLKRYIISQRNLPLPYNKMLNLMSTMAVMVYKIKEEIIAAPPIDMLKIHCGPKGYSLEEYRAYGTAGIYVDFVHTPFIYSPVSIIVERVATREEIERKIASVGIQSKLSRRLKTTLKAPEKTTTNTTVTLKSSTLTGCFESEMHETPAVAAAMLASSSSTSTSSLSLSSHL